MSKLFVRKPAEFDTYEVACAQIWNYLLEVGYPNFDLKDVYRLWSQFSEECYSAGFMTVDKQLVNNFISWLETQEVE